ncbi:MAG: hypothetical protein GWN01_16105 [Nitrosopumilaceae archaeon]|nr:hypothetical protein [Nitrosopumilaceae archaeon]NIU02361.1 hypothetical protein [Nitrosopumilaceae archaeon]NIU88818.1 hypothetical protein [Nitrosopumilaceae archaeon]NIV66943.1 hypothetical protein [Nitrosopumilaceae archaeon]NIX62962.1 hypothetical protein [Nitrosopumilaceae archaeon]
MVYTFQLETTNYEEDRLLVKKALSQFESLCDAYNGYLLSEPVSKFGWTFFKLAMKPPLEMCIEKKFEDMLNKYRWSSQSEKFTRFLQDYFDSKGCSIKVKLIDR